jgi:4-hydroxybenzoate polyprenyltransferase
MIERPFARIAAMDLESMHMETGKRSLARSYLKALRPHQWLKNALVFVPMLAAHQITADSLWKSFLAFIIFSLVASSVYILNDLLDLASDRAHPRKRNRPFAAGIIPIAHGIRLAPLLLFAGLVIAFPLGRDFILLMLAYWVVTTIYSLSIKRKIIIDIVTLAGLYTLRIVAGGVATGITLSFWLLAFSIFIFFALASVKRQAELVDSVAANSLQIQGRGYESGDLPLVANMAISSGYVSVLVLALYVNSPDVLELYRTPAALWGICLVLLYWISRMVIVTHRGAMHDDPLVYAVKDPASQVCFLIVVALGIGGTLI